MRARGVASPDRADAVMMSMDRATTSTVPVIYVPGLGRSILDERYGPEDVRLTHFGTEWGADW